RRPAKLICLPMVSAAETGATVTALQRHAAVIVQKSLYEGFGLTVTEAMWKSRPVVASAVGGIREQIRPDRDGLLIDDPTDFAATARAISRLLSDRTLATHLARTPHYPVASHFLLHLPPRHLPTTAPPPPSRPPSCSPPPENNPRGVGLRVATIRCKSAE